MIPVPSICAAHETWNAARAEVIDLCGSRSRRIELTGCMMDQIARNGARTACPNQMVRVVLVAGLAVGC